MPGPCTRGQRTTITAVAGRAKGLPNSSVAGQASHKAITGLRLHPTPSKVPWPALALLGQDQVRANRRSTWQAHTVQCCIVGQSTICCQAITWGQAYPRHLSSPGIGCYSATHAQHTVYSAQYCTTPNITHTFCLPTWASTTHSPTYCRLFLEPLCLWSFLLGPA